MQPSLHCTQIHQKPASSWGQVFEIRSRERKPQNRICKINVSFRASQDICYWDSSLIFFLCPPQTQGWEWKGEKRESKSDWTVFLPPKPLLSAGYLSGKEGDWKMRLWHECCPTSTRFQWVTKDGDASFLFFFFYNLQSFPHPKFWGFWGDPKIKTFIIAFSLPK